MLLAATCWQNGSQISGTNIKNQNHQEIEIKQSCWTCRFSVGANFFYITMDGSHCHGIARSILSLFFGRQLPPSQPEVGPCGAPTIPSRVQTFGQIIVMSGDTTHHHPKKFQSICSCFLGFPGWSVIANKIGHSTSASNLRYQCGR